MEGKLVEIGRGRGEGYVSYTSEALGVQLGSAPGSVKRAFMSLFLPRPEGEKPQQALLSLGVRASTVLRPFRWKVVVDGATVTREFKPQFVSKTDNGVYMKAVYDVRPLLSRRIMERVSHRMIAFYDSFQPVTLADASMMAVFGGRGMYSYSYHIGAVSLEPGDSVKVDANLGGAIGERVAVVSLHIPSSSSRISIVAGGSEPVEVSGPGYRRVRVKVPYKGGLIPVAIRYHDTGERFYPKIVVLSEVIVHDVSYPEPRLKIEISEVSEEGDKVVIKGVVENRGEGVAVKPIVVVLGLGIRLATQSLGDQMEPGSQREFQIEADLSKTPVRPSSLTVRIVWNSLGRALFDDVHIRV